MIRVRELLLVLAIGLFWGLNWPAVKTILSEVPPWTLRAAGLSLGALLLILVTIASRQSMRVGRQELAWLAIAGLFTVFGFNIFAAFGQLHTATSTATIIAFTMPMWAMLFSFLLLGEALTVPRLIALGVGLSGLLVLIGPDLGLIAAKPAGLFLMLGSAISWALGTVVLKSRTWTINPLPRTAWLVAISAVPMIAGAFLFEDPLATPIPSRTVSLVFAYHVIFPMVICHAAWVSLVDRLPASVAAIGTLLIPIVGVLSSTILLHDPLTWNKLAALVLVLASIMLTFMKRRPRTVQGAKLSG